MKTTPQDRESVDAASTTRSTGRSTTRPDPRKGERTRRRILDVALEIFAERGYSGVSLRAVAARVGMTHAGVLHHFSGKEDLLMTMMIERDDAEIAAMREYVEHISPPGGEPLTLTSIALPWLIRNAARNQTRPDLAPFQVKMSAEATDVDHPAHDYFCDRYTSLRKLLTRAFTHEFATTGDDGSDPALCAQQLLALADGLQLQLALDPDSVDVVDSLLAFLRSLGVEPNGWAEIPVPVDRSTSRSIDQRAALAVGGS